MKGDGYLNEKYPGGEIKQKELLEKEGHKIIFIGKKYFVEDLCPNNMGIINKKLIIIDYGNYKAA